MENVISKRRQRFTIIIIPYLVVLFSLHVYGQNKVIDEYINIALENNIALKQKQYSYEKSLAALKEAKRKYLPSVSLEAKYSRADGGRTVTIPFGELLNPVYQNLDVINNSLEQVNPSYPDLPTDPQVDDYTINFIREKEQETKLQAVMPIFNSAIISNHKLKKGLSDLEEINVDIYKRELVKEIKTAYVNYLKTLALVDLYENTLKVVKESLRNSESLFENDKITIDEVYAAKAQVKEIEKEFSEAQKNKVMAHAYFNFLLNRNFETDIIIEQQSKVNFINYELDSLKQQSVNKSEEMEQLNKYLQVNSNQVKLEQGDFLPQISLWASYGYQGEDYSFNSESDLGMIGISLSWNLFDSGQRKAKIQQAQIEKKITQEKKLEAEKKIQLDVINTYYSMITARDGIELAEQELKNYKRAFELVGKKYEQGMANHLEYTQALNDKLNANNKLILARYEYEIQQINLERITSSYKFKTNENNNEKTN